MALFRTSHHNYLQEEAIKIERERERERDMGINESKQASTANQVKYASYLDQRRS